MAYRAGAIIDTEGFIKRPISELNTKFLVVPEFKI